MKIRARTNTSLISARKPRHCRHGEESAREHARISHKESTPQHTSNDEDDNDDNDGDDDDEMMAMITTTTTMNERR